MLTRNYEQQQLPSKRILAIHDLSGHSRTSLMAIIPVMNHLGISVTALPTAVLSSNTEQDGFEMVDMTPHLKDFLKHWSLLKLSFSSIYSGFLSSDLQVEIVFEVFKRFRTKQTLIVVDPVMADNGKLYTCFTPSIIDSMKRLVTQANLITPNLTEAAFLLGESFQNRISYTQAKNWCNRLAAMGPNQVVITNIPLGKDTMKTSTVAFDKTKNKHYRSICRFIPVNFPGTGDIFTSVLTSLLLNGTDFFPAISKTVRFVCRAISLTAQADSPIKEGILLEQAISLLPSP